MLPRTLSVKEAADCLKVQPRTVRIWISHGKMSASKVGKSYIIPEPEVEKMISSSKPVHSNSFADMDKKDRLNNICGCLRETGITMEQVFAERRIEAESRKLKAERCIECQ